MISASAISLLYPAAWIDGYPREEFIDDLIREAEADIRECLDQGAAKVQIDFTEGRLSVKLNPSRRLLRQFIDLSETDRRRVLGIIREHARPDQTIFIGVVDPINPRVETPEEIRDRILEAAEILDSKRLGSTDDCGFSPFGDDLSTARDTAFAKIRASARNRVGEPAARPLRIRTPRRLKAAGLL